MKTLIARLLLLASLLLQAAIAHADNTKGKVAIVIAQAETPAQADSLHTLFARLHAFGLLRAATPSVTTTQLHPCLAKAFPAERDCIRQQLAQARQENPAAATTIALLLQSVSEDGEVQVTCLGPERIGQRPFNVTINVPLALGNEPDSARERQHFLTCLEG
ncbi:MAG: hypothetical protein Q8J78_14915 [Moraxellaceae bacterium]|nr:hypothetical protein [Moraxellaceae bacterium]